MRPEIITLRQLRAILAVDKTGSITAAAERLNLSVPAVHSQIKGLEDALGCKMLERNPDGSGSQLTENGVLVRDSAARVETILTRMGDDVASLNRGQRGQVVLGVVSTGKYFAPRLVKWLREKRPEVELVLSVGNREQVIDELDRGVTDLAIMGRPPRQPVVAADPLGPHPHGLVAAPDHPLAGKPQLSFDDLRDELFLSREEGSGTRILMTRYLDRIGEGYPFSTTVLASNETIKQAVMAGLGIGFLSLHTVTDELAAGRMAVLTAPGLPIERHWFLVRPTAFPPRPAVCTVRGEILRMQGSYLPRPSIRG